MNLFFILSVCSTFAVMKLRHAIFLLSHIFLLGLYAQPHVTEQETDALTRYARNIINFNREYPQEKVYLHMDNRSYYIGDTIWFKAYVMNATTLHPTQLSGVLYVELLNEKGVEMEHKKLRMENGMCHGEFVLKDDYRTGYYEIRAYTRYMLNWGNVRQDGEELAYELMNVAERSAVEYDYKRENGKRDIIPDYNPCIFSRTFPVYKAPEKGMYKHEMEYYPFHTLLAFPKETNSEFREDDLKLSFYPEGGNFITGINNTVAFEATDQWGRKQQIEGYITEKKDGQILTFHSDVRGRGTFTIVPEPQKKYIAHVTHKNKNYRFQLPQPLYAGVALHLSPPVAEGNAYVELTASTSRPTELLGMSLQCRGKLLAFDTLTVRSGTTLSIAIPFQKLQAGVNQLTIFNKKGEILGDRLFFVPPPSEQAVLQISEVPDSVKPYEAISLGIQVLSSGNWPAHGVFSLSVTDADERKASFDTRDIRSELLLSSELRGFIEDVDSYFSPTDDSLMAANIDLLMMVQGWRRYEWRTMASDNHTPLYTPEKGLQLDGYVISDIVSDKSRRNPDNYPRIPNLTMEVSIKSPMVTFIDTCGVDSSGCFHLDINRFFLDEAAMTMILHGREKKKWYQHIIAPVTDLKFSYPIIHRVFSPLPEAYTYYQNHTPTDEKRFSIGEAQDWVMEGIIDEVTIKKRYSHESKIYYENPDMTINYSKEWNHVIDRGCPLMNYYGSYNDDNTVLLNYHLGRMRLSQSESQLREYDSIYIRYAQRYYKPYHMPDTIRVYTNLCSREPQGRWQLDPETAHRDLLRCTFDYFKRSESPRRAPYMPKEGRRDTYFEGYSRVASFYSPDYSECALPDTADYRRTLYWNPDVWTDHKGRASVSFYNNRNTKHLHIRAEGFTRYGEFIVYDSEKAEENQ